MGTKGFAGRFGSLTAAALVSLATLALLLFPQQSLAEAEVGSPGSAAGQLSEPRAVAVDETDDLLYVADTANDRIAVFDATSGVFIKAFGWGVADGTTNALQVCTTTCFKGIGGKGAGQLDTVIGIAVDNDPTSPGFHDVYVFEDAGLAVENIRVQKFTPEGEFVWMVGGKVNKTTEGNLCTAASGNTCGAGISGNGEGFFNHPNFGGVVAVGPGGTVYVADQIEGASPRPSRVQKYSPEGAYLGQQLLSVSGGAGKTTALAVDASGNLYVGTGGANGALRKYSPAGTELLAVNPSFNVTAVALGTDGHIFVADNSNVGGELNSIITEYDTTGAIVRVFYGSLEERVTGLAVYPPSSLGDIFAAEQATGTRKGRVLAIDFPSPGPVVYPKPSAIFASPVSNTKATLNAKINPEGEATTYIVEYISDADFKAAGETFGTGTLKTSPSSSIGSDFALHPVKANLTGLFPETVYHYRFVATNASGTNAGPVEEFKTQKPVEFGEHWTTDVGTATATLHAEVNPQGISSTARFQYTEFSDTTYANAKEAPAPPFDLGEGEAMQEVSTEISDLAEGTTYRYRLVVTNRCKPEPEPLCDFAEVEGTFTTFAALEPIVGCSNDQLRAEGSGQFLPDCRGYEMVSPVDKNGANIEPLFNNLNFPANLDQAALDGDSITYSAYKAFADPESSPYTNQYLARRGGSGWQSEAISPVREGATLMPWENSQLDRQYKVFSEDLCSGWIIQDANPTLAPEAPEGLPGLYRRDNCDAGVGNYEAITTVEPPVYQDPQRFIPEPQGVSADGSVTIFTVKSNLTPDAPPQPEACVNQTDPSLEQCLRRLYEARAGSLEYVCILPDDTPFAGACSAGQTWETDLWKGRANELTNAISADGSRIFWTAASVAPGPLYVRIDGTDTVPVSSSSSTWFLSASPDGSKAIYSVGDELFEFDVDAETETLIADEFLGFAGASEDASRVYFASSKVLTGEEENSEGDKAEAGKPNLYLYEAGSGFRFIATLAGTDLPAGDQFLSSPVAKISGARLSRVTPDGEQITFMSYSPITGYDNKDAVSGELNMEVFFYDATADGGAGRVLCPSCNPTNARSEGRDLTQKFLNNRRASARIPTATSHLYGERLIAADGNRLYFNSYEALSSRDTNDEEDVYQWEAPDTGSCTTSSPTYHEVSGGCVDLISSGQSSEGSEFVDASADGEDVFFKTYESLVDQDPHRMDLYDARVGGGFAGLPDPPVICQGEACQAPPQLPPVAVAPATRVSGPGNPAWPQPKPKPRKCPKGKHKVKVKGKVRCVKNKKKTQKNRTSSKTRRAGR